MRRTEFRAPTPPRLTIDAGHCKHVAGRRCRPATEPTSPKAPDHAGAAETRVQAKNCSAMIRSSSEWSGSNSSCTAAERSCWIDTDSI
jgi:hypothetical protein